MLNSMDGIWNDWSLYKTTENKPLFDENMVRQETMGYLTTVNNFQLYVLRNAGHMAPRDQPEYALHMFENFIYGTLA